MKACLVLSFLLSGYVNISYRQYLCGQLAMARGMGEVKKSLVDLAKEIICDVCHNIYQQPWEGGRPLLDNQGKEITYQCLP